MAARCVQLIGALPRLTDPLVVECRSANGMASGPLPWTLAGRLHERLPRSEVLIADGPESLAGLAAMLEGRTLVAVVRDPSRHRWQHRLLELAVERTGPASRRCWWTSAGRSIRPNWPACHRSGPGASRPACWPPPSSWPRTAEKRRAVIAVDRKRTLSWNAAASRIAMWTTENSPFD